jgi:hypothetical protein
MKLTKASLILKTELVFTDIGREILAHILWAMVLSILGFLFTSCGSYSFTGTNLSPEVKTISIQNFENVSGAGPPTLTINFSERTRDYFQRNTTLRLQPAQGDLQFEGTITSYALSPLPPSANDVASQTRLTITVKANFVNTRNEDENFEQPFTFFADFPSNTNLSSVEPQLIETISDQIILQMFNRSVANW